MAVKLLYNSVTISDSNIDISYNPSNGLIYNKNTNASLCHLTQREIKPYFFYKVEFDSYHYAQIYSSKNDSYKTQLISSTYKIYLYLNINAILRCISYKKFDLLSKLTYVLTRIQIFELINPIKNYNSNESSIRKFINYRRNNLMYLIPWYYYRINNNYVFDLKKSKLLPSSKKFKINFKRKGAIIETNNVIKLINENFIPKIKSANLMTLVILPSNMKKIYSKKMIDHDIIILTFDYLCQMEESDIKKYKKTHFKQGIYQIIIHECYFQFMVQIKNLLKYLKSDLVWVINSLPLTYYAAKDYTNLKLTINEISTIANIWMNFSETDKSKYKTEMIRMFYTKLNQLYTRMYYENNHLLFDTKKLTLSLFETDVYNQINSYYDNWKNKLTNDPKNIYSMSSLKINNKISAKMFNTFMMLITSVIDDKNVTKFFSNKVKETMTNIKLIHKLINKGVTKTFDHLTQNEEHMLMNFNDQMKSLLDHHQRYLDTDVYHTYDEKSCLICYSNNNLIKTKLICGHCICLECIIPSIAHGTICPLCKEFVNLGKIAIIKDSIENYCSEIITYLKNLNHTNLLITDLNLINSLVKENGYKLNVLNINHKFVSTKIKNLPYIKNINVLLTPDKYLSKRNKLLCNQIISYFNCFDQKPKITKILI